MTYDEIIHALAAPGGARRRLVVGEALGRMLRASSRAPDGEPVRFHGVPVEVDPRAHPHSARLDPPADPALEVA